MPLAGAPFASWVLARLVGLSGPDAGADAEPGPVEVIEDAVFVRDWIVADSAGAAVAKLQIQGGMIGVGLLGVQTRTADRGIVDALTAAMVARPFDVGLVRTRVRDPVWAEVPEAFRPEPSPDTANQYGWDGVRYLGVDNVAPIAPR